MLSVIFLTAGVLCIAPMHNTAVCETVPLPGKQGGDCAQWCHVEPTSNKDPRLVLLSLQSCVTGGLEEQ